MSNRSSEPRPSFVSTRVSEARRYYLELKPAPTREITVVCGGCERVRPDYIVERKTFPFFAIEFVAEGEGAVWLSGEKFRLQPGVAFAYGPGIAHSIRTEPRRPMLKYYIDFVGARAGRLLKASPIPPGGVVQVSAPGDVQALFENLQANGSAESTLGPAICAALVPVLLLKIEERAIPHSAGTERAFATYRRVRAWIEAHFLEVRTLEEAAKASGVNLSYLCRLFQRFDHQTPYRYLLRLKMSRATELLLDRGLLVKEAAAELGFSDPFNFSRTFKTVFGVSPETFLRQSVRR